MTVKISAKKELGVSKLIPVKESNKNFRRTLDFQKQFLRLQIEEAKREQKGKDRQAKIDAGEEVEPIDELAQYEEMNKQYEDMEAFQKLMTDYITDILHLSDEYVEKLDDMEFYKTQEFAMSIVEAVMNTKATEAKPEDKGLED